MSYVCTVYFCVSHDGRFDMFSPYPLQYAKPGTDDECNMFTDMVGRAFRVIMEDGSIFPICGDASVIGYFGCDGTFLKMSFGT